jgi:hypothetical protein
MARLAGLIPFFIPMNADMVDTPESQRVTLPSPQPFAAVAPRRRSVGEYLIVNERAAAKRARRSPVEREFDG